LNRIIDWKRLAIEAAAIVASILLAFAIDAWWDERGERMAEVVLLERLRHDFTEIQAALTGVDTEHQEASDACIYLLGLAVGDVLPATSEVDRMVAVVFLSSRTFNPGLGAIASFNSSDSGRLVRNQALADKLLAWPGVVEELQEEEANLQKGVAERWSPYMASRVNLGPYVAAAGALMQGLPQQIAAPTNRQPFQVDGEFINVVLDRYKWQQIALRDLGSVRHAVVDILALLDAELDD
jgi:hypothetical protein